MKIVIVEDKKPQGTWCSRSPWEGAKEKKRRGGGMIPLSLTYSFSLTAHPALPPPWDTVGGG